MTSVKKNLCLLFCFAAVLLHCKSPEKEESTLAETILYDTMPTDNDDAAWAAAEAAEKKMPLADRIVMLQQQTEAAWHRLDSIDQQKFADIAYITTNFAKIKATDKALLDSVIQLTKLTWQSRYTTENLNQRAVVDAYNTQIELLMDKVERLETTVPYMKHCRPCFDKFEAIRQNDGKDLMLRVSYTSAAKEFNELLSQEQAALAQLGSLYTQLKPFKVFPEGE